MISELDLENARELRSSRRGATSMGMLRVTLLFGSAAIALGLIAAPIAEKGTDSYVASAGFPAGVDRMTTGSISNDRKYTVRRSVLQSKRDSICIINADGSFTGDC